MTTEKGKDSRQLQSWIESFCEYSRTIGSPTIWSKWTAIAVIAGALERKVWVRTKGSDLYPNLYIGIVGPPGIGKSEALKPGERILRTLEARPNSSGLYIAPSILSHASLLDALVDAKRKIVRPADPVPITEFHYFTVFASELGVFLPEYEPRSITRLIKLYDGEYIEERLRSQKNGALILHSPQITLIGGTTPSYLNSFLPEGAWDGGFTSRVIFIYSGEKNRTAIFEKEGEFAELERLYRALVADLKQVFGLFGKMDWDADAAEAISAWHVTGEKPVPNHRKLEHYNSRRLAHVIKLCMIASAARGGDMTIKLEDYQTAQDWLVEAEGRMPDIFNAMGGLANEGQAMEDVWFFIYKLYMKDGKPLPKHVLVNFLRERVPPHAVMKVIDIMVESQMLRYSAEGYTPAPKQ